jgi:gliding motility-associated-like protein
MKRLLFVFLFLFTASAGQAQSVSPAVVNTAGGTFTQSGITYEWSVGELALVETMINAKAGVTNGLLQSIPSNQLLTNGFLLYPNNIVTPDGDGKNDTWIIKDIEKYPDNEVTVFDRAGRSVFKAKNYQNTWNGNLSGTALSEDTYYYILKLRKDGKTSTLKGFITIIY